MLSELSITDFALVEELAASLSPGLNVLTGETGAGKSIIIDAINAILGVRTGTDLVRTGAPRAIVQAAFALDDAPDAAAECREGGHVAEDGLLIISRELQASGKTQCRINGRLATVTMLRDFGRNLVDVHGQHEHQSLLSIGRHLDLLDSWAGSEALALRARVAEQHRALAALERQIEKLDVDERDRARRLDLYQFQIREIDAARLHPGEEEDLEADRHRLANAERLSRHADQAYEHLKGDERVLDALAGCMDDLRALADIDPAATPMLEAAQAAYYQLEDAAAQLRAYRDGVEFNPARLEQVQERLEAIRLLKRKYGDSIAEVLAYREQAAADLEGLAHAEEHQAELRVRREALQREAEALAARLTALRHEASERFSGAVEAELALLAMERTRFRASIAPQALGATGADRVEFLISPNPGEPLKPLARIASGGEMSRIMLALKSVLARVDRVPTLIFDEIDAGIGGRTAGVIAAKLAALARDRQVICVTHLPQIAGRADAHFLVRKEVRGDRTVVQLHPLTEPERVEELARMLGGSEGSSTAREHAREMLAQRAAGEAA
ncbi:MAG: DNA repair protein RecN [Armatimonadetes bacterium]|nr:DNA repair protein RecN [Armatimonadota bacterium]